MLLIFLVREWLEEIPFTQKTCFVQVNKTGGSNLVLINSLILTINKYGKNLLFLPPFIISEQLFRFSGF